jgi:hypothetical protein
MATKLDRLTIPDGHSREDFEAFGPVVIKDTEWGACRLADLGCFCQDEGVNSNKYYHLAVVKSKINGKFYAYFEFGRTRPDGRPNSPAFQFFECSSEAEAAATCEKQFHAKNTKRGVWQQTGSKERLVPKPKSKLGKDGEVLTHDLYAVRPLATRLVGLPCAENIANEDAQGAAGAAKKANGDGKKKAKKKTVSKVDTQTRKLFADLMGGVQTYSKAFLGSSGGPVTLPSQHAIDEARGLLDDAMARVGAIEQGMKSTTEKKLVAAQVADQQLGNMTKLLYGIIPKAVSQTTKKSAADKQAQLEGYILNTSNILRWQDDMDVLETALQSADMDVEEDATDHLQGIPAEVHWVPPSDSLYKWLVGNGQEGWWPKATRGESGVRGSKGLKVHGLWAVERHGDRARFRSSQERVLGEMPKTWNEERPLYNEKKRPDLNVAERKLFWQTNSSLLFHGTRSVNVPGIVRENLRFPKELTGVVVNGAMFGPGSYFADDWGKSAGYCSNCRSGRGSFYGGGGEVQGRRAFMFGFDVILGVPHVAEGSQGFRGAPSGTHCVFGKFGKTRSWGGTLANNEWIIYVKGHCEMRYLAEVEW